MKINRILIFLLSLFSLSCLQAQDHTSLQKSIEDLLREQKLPGAVWTTLDGDSITIQSAGINNLQTGAKLLPTDKVHVGSITKTVLALGMLRLATEGKIQLDQPVKAILPNLPLSNPWGATTPVTVRHLLDHTAGLSDLRLWHFFSSTATPNTALSEFYTRNPAVLKVHAKPGSFFAYSNMGYTILGMIIEAVTQQPYEKYLDENLLKPIGMHNSTFRFLSQEGAYKTDDLAMGHFDNGKTAPALPIYLRPAGQFTTTAADMGVLLQFILSKGKTENGYFIDSSYFENYGKPAYTIAYRNGIHNGYALGTFLRDRHGVTGIAHSGNIIGYRAMFYIFPKEKKGFFIAHNMDSETADYEVFNKTLIDHLGIPKKTSWSYQVHPTEELGKWEGYYMPAITKVEPFRLFDMLSALTKVEFNGNKMLFTPFQKKTTSLDHLGNQLFQSTAKVDPSVFLYEDGSQLFLTTGISTLQKVSGWKVFTLSVSCLLGLLGLLLVCCSGIYQAVKWRSKFFTRPLAWSFLGMVLFITAVIMVAAGGMIHTGNKNAGSVLLWISTILLPVLSLVSLFFYAKKGRMVLGTAGFWAIILLVQFTIVLYIYGLVPFTTWK